LGNPYWRWLYRQRLRLIVGMTSTLVMNALLLLVPLLIGRVVSRLPDYDTGMVMVLFAALLGQTVFGFVSTYVLGALAAQAVTDLRSSLFHRMMTTTVPFYDRHRSSAMVSSLISDAHIVEQALATIVPALAQNVPVVVAIIVVMFVQNWSLTLALVLVVTPGIIVIGLIGRSLRSVVRVGQALLATMVVVAQESLSGIRQIKAMTREEFVLARFGQTAEQFLSFKQQRVMRQAAMEGLLPLAIGVSILVCGWGIQRGRANGTLSVEQITTFASYFFILALNLRRLSYVYSALEIIRGGIDRLRTLERDTAEVEGAGGEPLTPGRGAIVFDDVCFTYQTSPAGVSHINLRVDPGDVVAIVGPNGAGKSTLLNLMLRFYHLDHGSIMLDGQQATACDMREWRQQFAVVTRDPLILSVSVAQNIALGREGATQAEIEEAARTVGLHDVILALPHGYESHVGEGGVLLSSGQRQRLALARVFLQNPRVVVLDEATTSLDAESEGTFTAALHLWAGRRTILVVAHRPHPGWPIRRVVHMEGGRIISDERVAPQPRVTV
jgi:ABC-type multidrug transport system fused ATPase/permease subunit